MKKRNLVLGLASLCGISAFACSYILINNGSFITHSVENEYTVKLISSDFKDNGKITLKAGDSNYDLNLDYGNGIPNGVEYVAMTNGYISNTGINSSIINGIKSIKVASEGRSVSLYCGNNPSLLMKVELDSTGLATLDSAASYFKIVNTGYSIIYYVEITYTCTRSELGDYIVSGDSVSNASLTSETIDSIGWKQYYFSSNSDGSLKISDYVPELDSNVFVSIDGDTYLLNYKKSNATSSNNVIHYSNEDDTYELALPSSLDVMKVKVDGVDVNSYGVSGSKVSLTYKNASMNKVDVFTSDDNVYRFYISKLDSLKRDEAYLTNNEIEFTKISSVEQFKSIFKLDGSSISQDEKSNFYKTYLLDCDIDLNGSEIDPIGYQTGVEDPQGFFGNIYGNGHTISNFVLSKTSSARNGLFSTLNGNVYDLNLSSFTNTASSWSVGGLAGVIGEGDKTPVVSNVNIINGDINIVRGGDSTKPELNGEGHNIGAIAGFNAKSTIENCTYNGYNNFLVK